MIRIFICIVVFGAVLYAFIDKQNKITKLRMEIPVLASQLQSIEQENTRLRYEIDKLESPERLLEVSKHPEYRHLKHANQDQVIELSK